MIKLYIYFFKSGTVGGATPGKVVMGLKIVKCDQVNLFSWLQEGGINNQFNVECRRSLKSHRFLCYSKKLKKKKVYYDYDYNPKN